MSKGKGLSGGAIAGIVIGSVVGLLMILLVLFFVCCRGRKGSDKKSGFEGGVKQREVGQVSGEKSWEDTTGSMSAIGKSTGGVGLSGRSGSNAKSLVFFGKGERVFDLEDLLRASAEVLGKGTFGTAYKAVLETGLVVAVKRLKEVAVPEKEFREKVEVVGRMEHENLVALRAYYYSRDEKLLVYDYMPMGSLSALLHGKQRLALVLPGNLYTLCSLFRIFGYDCFICRLSCVILFWLQICIFYSNELVVIVVYLSCIPVNQLQQVSNESNVNFTLCYRAAFPNLHHKTQVLLFGHCSKSPALLNRLKICSHMI